MINCLKTKKALKIRTFLSWWTQRDSNPYLSPCKDDAFPVKLQARLAISIAWLLLLVNPSLADSWDPVNTPKVDGVPYFRYHNQKDPRVVEARVFMASLARERKDLGLKTTVIDFTYLEKKLYIDRYTLSSVSLQLCTKFFNLQAQHLNLAFQYFYSLF